MKKKVVTRTYIDLLDELSEIGEKPVPSIKSNHLLSGWKSARTNLLAQIRAALNKLETRHKNIYSDTHFFTTIYQDLDILESKIIISMKNEKDTPGYDIVYINDDTINHIEQTYALIRQFVSKVIKTINDHRNFTAEPIDLKDPQNRKIFIVHGRNHKPLEGIKKILNKNNKVEPIVLIDEVSSGSDFILNKFLEHANKAQAAIILATSDIKETKDGQKYSRPNVMLELGYFLAKFSLKRIIILIDDDSVIPSDINGVEYINISKDKKWKSNLTKKIELMGF